MADQDNSGSGYSLLGHDDSKFTIGHPDGSSFDVAKQGLDPSVATQIMGLPTPNASPKADTPDSIAQDAAAGVGNAPPPPPASAETNPPPDSPPSLSQTVANFQQNNPELANLAQAQPTPKNPNAQIAPNGPQSIMGIYGDAMKQQSAALQGIGAAKSQEGKAAAQAYGQYAAKTADLAQKQQTNEAALQSEMTQQQQAIQNGQIDPNRYWNSRTGAQKTGAIISVILGAIGGGIDHSHGNVGMDLLQDHINKDIDSQKNDLANKQTLYSMNLQKYRDERTATAATQLQYNNALQAQLGMAAARSGSQQAMQQASLAQAGLKAQAIPLMQQIAAAQTQAQSLGIGNQSGGLPVGGEPLNLLSDPKYQEKRIVVGNKAYQAPSPDDAKDLKNLQSEYEPIRNVVAQLNQLQGDPTASIPGSPANQKAQALRAYAVPRLNKMHGLNRLSEEDVKLMGDQLSDPTKFNKYLSGTIKNDTFMRNLDEDLESNYKTRLIGYQGKPTFNSFQPSGQGQG